MNNWGNCSLCYVFHICWSEEPAMKHSSCYTLSTGALPLKRVMKNEGQHPTWTELDMATTLPGVLSEAKCGHQMCFLEGKIGDPHKSLHPEHQISSPLVHDPRPLFVGLFWFIGAWMSLDSNAVGAFFKSSKVKRWGGVVCHQLGINSERGGRNTPI